jgi:MFS family permease
VSALVRLLSGWLADRTDRPKWVAFSGYALSAVARLFLLVATSLGSVAAVVTADRIGKGVRTAPRDAMISAATPTEHLGRAFGVHRALDTAGAAAGPLLAFAVLWMVPDGYATVMVLSLAFAVVGVALLGLLGPDQRLRREVVAVAKAGPAGPTFAWRDLGDRRLRPLLLVAAGLGLLTIGDGFVYLVLLAGGGFGVEWFPLLFVGTNLAYLLLAVPVGLLSDRVGRARVMVLGHLALVAAYVCASLAGPGVAGIVGTLALLGLFYAATDGQVPALAGRLVPQRALTSGIAAAQTVVAVARMVAAAGFGLLWHWTGPAAALGAVAVALALAVLVAATQIRRLDSSVGDVETVAS